MAENLYFTLNTSLQNYDRGYYSLISKLKCPAAVVALLCISQFHDCFWQVEIFITGNTFLIRIR